MSTTAEDRSPGQVLCTSYGTPQVIPSQLDGLRKKERLRELYRQHPSVPGDGELAVLAAIIGPQAGLDEHTALAWLTEFASAN